MPSQPIWISRGLSSKFRSCSTVQHQAEREVLVGIKQPRVLLTCEHDKRRGQFTSICDDHLVDTLAGGVQDDLAVGMKRLNAALGFSLLEAETNMVPVLVAGTLGNVVQKVGVIAAALSLHLLGLLLQGVDDRRHVGM